MPTRRHFLKTLAIVPPALVLSPPLAAADASRVALVIGNSRYAQSPLINPANDARDFGTLLDTAGFSVERHLDLGRQDMMAAIERFGKAVARADTRLAVFYYAGHGVQLDWRNYLLPVDANVDTAEQLKQRCVDLGMLLGTLATHKDKTFVIVLDACRDDPFAGTYRPVQKGLSQFDAPVGSLLAYATSPGNVASDGSGKNGLYTENLLRELSQRGTRIEDALKRVRLNVRLGSRGAQIPWETTSLESDVYIFSDGGKKLTEAEIEKLFEAEMVDWGRIKNSKQIEDWVGYLRSYPNGRFAEIAQNRLSRLLADVERKTAQAPVAAPPAAEPPNATALELAPGLAAPQLIVTSHNPNSAGRFPLARRFTVGDEAVFRISDLMTGVEAKRIKQVITKVDVDADRVEANGGEYIYDLMGNRLRSPETGPSDVVAQMVPAELQVGKKWTAGWKQQNPRFGEQLIDFELRIVAFEKLTLELGTFDAFRIEAEGWIRHTPVKLERKFWIVPGINAPLRFDVVNRWQGRLIATDRIELVSLRQQSMDTSCASRATGSRNLVIKSGCG